MTSPVTDLLMRMPKAELHVHIEGTLEPELAFRLAQRNAVPLAYGSLDSLRAAYAFSDLPSFLAIYHAGASVLRTEADFYDLTLAYLLRARADNVVHAEIFFDPHTHTGRGIAFATVIGGICRALDEAAAALGMSAGLVMSLLPHLSEEEALTTLEQAVPYRHRLLGVGLDLSELGNSPHKFVQVSARCRRMGLHVVAHARAKARPSCIVEALDRLGAERIDHGVRCLKDAALVKRLAREHIPLTVCPLSHVKLQVFDGMAEHDWRTLLDAGLCATVNSDDPAYFGGYLNDNLQALAAALPLQRRHALQLACNSFQAAFLSPAAKRTYLARVEHFFDQ